MSGTVKAIDATPRWEIASLNEVSYLAYCSIGDFAQRSSSLLGRIAWTVPDLLAALSKEAKDVKAFNIVSPQFTSHEKVWKIRMNVPSDEQHPDRSPSQLALHGNRASLNDDSEKFLSLFLSCVPTGTERTRLDAEADVVDRDGLYMY